jgi:uncharacterized phosphosugar-binding protein
MDSEHIKKYYQFCEIANGIKLYKPKDFMKMLEKSGRNEVWFDSANPQKKSGGANIAVLTGLITQSYNDKLSQASAGKGNESVKILLF